MKMRNKNNFSTILLLLITTSSICPMDQSVSNKENLVWVALAGAAIAGGALALRFFLSYVHSQPTGFNELPREIQQQIMSLVLTGANAESLEVAAQTINSLARVNKEFNVLINDGNFCKEIIENLAERFKCDQLTVIQALRIKATKDFLRELEQREQEAYNILRNAGF